MKWTTLKKDLKNVGFHFNFKEGDIVGSSDSFYHDGFMEWSVIIYQKIDGVKRQLGTIRESDFIKLLIDNRNTE